MLQCSDIANAQVLPEPACALLVGCAARTARAHQEEEAQTHQSRRTYMEAPSVLERTAQIRLVACRINVQFVCSNFLGCVRLCAVSLQSMLQLLVLMLSMLHVDILRNIHLLSVLFEARVALTVIDNFWRPIVF